MSYEHPVLTLSGNEITDTSRALGIEGDGRAVPDHSIGIWPAATNLITNGGFETDLTGWAAAGAGATLTRITTKSKFGTACAQLDATAQFDRLEGSVTTTIGLTYTYSVWVNRTEVTDLWRIQIDNSGAQPFTDIPTVLGWQRVVLSVVVTDASSILRVVNVSIPSATSTILVDGAQLELGPIATPYIETDGATAARAAARVQVPVAGLFTPTQGWVAARVRLGWANTSLPNPFPMIFDWGDDPLATVLIRVQINPGTVSFYRGAAPQADATLNVVAGDIFTVVAAWDATHIHISANGGAFVSAVNGTAGGNAPAALAGTGCWGAGTDFPIEGDILWLAAGSGTLTDTEAAMINAFGNRPPTPVELPGNPTAAYHPDAGIVVHPIGGPRNKLLS